jgi:hypothetical protein
MKDASRLTTFIALLLLVAALVTIKDGLPDFEIMSDTVLFILGGILIFRLMGGRCCTAKRGCRPANPPSA